MNKRNAAMPWPVLAVLVIAMLAVGLACGGEKATPTSVPPTATRAATATATSVPPTATASVVPTATATLAPGETPVATAVPTSTATAVPEPTATEAALTWMERYMQSPGYKTEWGQPQTGGILKIRNPRTASGFTPSTSVSTTQGHFTHHYHNALVRLDPWVGQDSIIGDLAKSWEWSGDMLHLTMKLEEGVRFQDNPNVPAEYNGGKIGGDEFTCEDAVASTERSIRPPAADAKNLTVGGPLLGHLNSVSCPDGPLGHTAVLNFDLPLAKTMVAMAAGHFIMLDKNYIEWLDTELPGMMKATTPENFMRQAGYGAMVPLEFQPDVVGKVRRNPTYWREGLPLVDGINTLIIKDYTTSFTALATGQIDIFERGSWAMQEGQVAQAERDFKDRIVMYPALHLFANGIMFNFDYAPFDDRRVRKAMSLALDRDDYLLFRKTGSYTLSVLAGDLAPRTYWSYTEEELRTWPGIRQPKDADIAEANRLLDEVFGAGKRFSITCQGVNAQDQADVCLFFKDQMKRALNVEVTLDLVEQAVSTTRANNCQVATSIGSSGGSTRIGDPDDWMFVQFHRGPLMTGPSARCMAESWGAKEPALMAELEALAEAQSAEMDPVKRKAMAQEWEYRFFDEMIGKILFGWNFTVPGTTTAVKGYHTFNFNVYSGIPLYERVWLAQ